MGFVSDFFIHLFFLNSIKFLLLFKTDTPDPKFKYFFVAKNILFFFKKIFDLILNIFNFSGNLYNKKLSVEFLKFIRGEKKFKGISELKNQIKKDILKAKKT